MVSEICFECLKETLSGGERLERKKFIISKDLELCENCGRYKQVVIAQRDKYYYLRRFKVPIISADIVLLPVTVVVLLLYRAIWKRKLDNKNKDSSLRSE